MNSSAWKIIMAILILLVGAFASFSPAQGAGNVAVMSSTGYRDPSGNYRVVGEVQNIGNQAVNFVQVTAQFYDSGNNPVDSRFDLTLLYVILAGRKSPFEIALLDSTESALVSRYSLSVTYVQTGDLPLKLRILSDTNYSDASGNLHVVGNLQNNGTQKLVNAKVVATYYDASSRVMATGLIGFDPDVTGDINPGQVVPFELVLENSRAQYVKTYALAAESNQYAMIPEFPLGTTLLILLIFLLVVVLARAQLRSRWLSSKRDIS